MKKTINIFFTALFAVSLLYLIGSAMFVFTSCSNSRVVIEHGTTRHDMYFIDYEITKLENNDIEVFTKLSKLNKAIVVYRDTIQTNDYKQKLAELYTKALYKIDTLRSNK